MSLLGVTVTMGTVTVESEFEAKCNFSMECVFG